MMDLKKWFKLCFINVLLFCTADIFLSQLASVLGYGIPFEDILIEYGNPLDIVCVLYNTNKLRPNASHYLTFLRNNETVPSEMIDILNSTAIKLHIDKPPKTTLDRYACQMDNVPVKIYFVTIGTKPQNVDDFNCISHNFDNFTCTWTPPQNYIKTIYTLTYTIQNRPSRYRYGCPAVKHPEPGDNDKRMSCFWNVSTTPQYRHVHEYFVFTLKMKNKLGETQMEKIFPHFAHVPDAPPKTNMGSFEIVAHYDTTLQHRDAYVYWQQIPKEQKNGPDFSYEIEVEGKPNLQPIKKTSSYAKFENLLLSDSYRFSVWSRNSNGTSLQKSSIAVPRQIGRVKKPKSITIAMSGSGLYELTWKAPELPRGDLITNYTIFWCKDKRLHQCEGQLDWTVVPSTVRVYNITLAKDEMFQFAISANTDRSSSGMVWATCTTILYNRNVSRLKDVWIKGVGPTWIQIAWKLDCSDRGSDNIANVEGFIIYYCPIVAPSRSECRGPPKNKTFLGDGSIRRGTVTNLIPYTMYMLTVASVTKHYNAYSQQSEPLYTTTLEDAPSAPENLRVTNVTHSTISLAWNSPISINGKLRFYRIRYRDGTDIVEQKVKLIDNYINNNCTLSNLTSDGNYNYTVTIAACTVACSKESNVVHVRTKAEHPG